MKRRSWIVLTICVVLAAGLVVAYFATQSGSTRLTQDQAIEMTRRMERSFENKNVNGILAYIATTPDTRISNLTTDQIRLLLVRYFRNSDKLSATLSNYQFTEGDPDAILVFDLEVHNDAPDSLKKDYSGRITLHLRHVEVPHLLGLYQTKEWRIVGADTTGPDLSTFGDGS